MKHKDLKIKSKDELGSILQKEKSSLTRFRFNIEGGKVKNVKSAREGRKVIARILTLLKENK